MKLCVLEMSKQLPVGNSEFTPCGALVARAVLALLSQPVSFLTFILQIVWSSCCRDVRESSCVGFSCPLGLSRNSWGPTSAGALECGSLQRLGRKVSPCSKEMGCHADTEQKEKLLGEVSCCQGFLCTS